MAWNLVKGDSKCAHLNSRKMAAAMKAYFLDIPEYQWKIDSKTKRIGENYQNC